MFRFTTQFYRLSLALILTVESSLACGSLEAGVDDYNGGEYALAMHELLPLAEKDNAEAQYYVGLMYANGQGELKNEITAAGWYLQSAGGGNVNAQLALGDMYAFGRGVAEDDAQAEVWSWRAATAGNVEAQLALSAAYAEGRGVAQNDDLANYWGWKVATAQAAIEKSKLDAEVAKLPTRSSITSNNSGPVIDLTHCQAPSYRRTGYGYHHSETLQVLFLVDAAGKIVETTLLDKSDWPLLDHDFLVSYSKTCTFKPAMKNGKAVPGLVKLQASWSVEP